MIRFEGKLPCGKVGWGRSEICAYGMGRKFQVRLTAKQ